MSKGKVFLVGAGPGDPGLLTLKGRQCLQRAQVVIYDYLANQELLRYCPAGAELIYVGKKAARHTLPQGGINRLIIDKAREGKMVVRLKGGDPFIFGRGGEEAQELAAAGLDFEVVPGVSSAVAAPAYAGIPLTHRDYTASCAFITGHEDPTKDSSNIAWDKIATGVGTLVFLMGVGNLPEIVRRLVENGRSPATPVALIRWGSTTRQRTVVGTLADIVEKAKEVKPPSIIIVGEVIALRPLLNWFESKPLFGKRVLVTRSREQASQLSASLREYGAQVLEVPTIRIVPADDYSELDEAIGELGSFDWLIFTSVNGVDYFLRRLQAQDKDVRELQGVRLAAIGPATAKSLSELRLRVDYVPAEYRAEGIVEGLRRLGVQGKRVLLARAEVAREILPRELARAGARVKVVSAYKTVRPDLDLDLLREFAPDVVTFTSSSTVNNFVEALGRDEAAKVLEKAVIASIGPITADTARNLGLATQIMPAVYTIPALVEAIVQYFTGGC